MRRRPGTPASDGAQTIAPDELAELSRAYADRQAPHMAQLAAWASDLKKLETLLWEHGLAGAPDPDVQLAAIGEVVAASLEAQGRQLAGDLSVRETVEMGRTAMAAAFDESVGGLLADRLMPLDHLDACVEAEPGAETEWTGPETRLAGRTPAGMVSDLRLAAADCMAVAQVMLREGEEDTAVRLARQADAASFEAYLITAAVLAGDHALATVELRWDLAAWAEPWPEKPSSGVVPTLSRQRQQLLAVVGAAEQEVLGAMFEPLLEE